MIRRPPLTSQQKLRHKENGDLSWLISHVVSVSGRCRHGLDPNKTAFHFPSTLFCSSIPKAFTHLLKITSVLMENQSQHLTQYYFSPNTATILLGNNFFTWKRSQDLGGGGGEAVFLKAITLSSSTGGWQVGLFYCSLAALGVFPFQGWPHPSPQSVEIPFTEDQGLWRRLCLVSHVSFLLWFICSISTSR